MWDGLSGLKELSIHILNWARAAAAIVKITVELLCWHDLE